MTHPMLVSLKVDNTYKSLFQRCHVHQQLRLVIVHKTAEPMMTVPKDFLRHILKGPLEGRRDGGD